MADAALPVCDWHLRSSAHAWPAWVGGWAGAGAAGRSMLHTYTADECGLSACRRVRGGLQQCARSADSPGGRGLLVLSDYALPRALSRAHARMRTRVRPSSNQQQATRVPRRPSPVAAPSRAANLKDSELAARPAERRHDAAAPATPLLLQITGNGITVTGSAVWDLGRTVGPCPPRHWHPGRWHPGRWHPGR